ncbi:cytochrome P450 [Rhodocollybia butyracea]|uniref:Cytochrome P450 n=1 Tax=Rhodocollybia butyracea TaxID=206335 RepID=A0A9P5PM50_9AGAR|nr:cytochrome P450 [Rhodocollybia butyracea]
MPPDMFEPSGPIYIGLHIDFNSGLVCCSAILVCAFVFRMTLIGPDPLENIPSIGYSGSISSYITALRYLWDGPNMIQEGYQKYKGGLFKIPMLGYWMVVATTTTAVEDIRKADDDTMSFRHALWKFLQTDYTIGPELRLDSYHVDFLRTTLTHQLTGVFPDIYDEALCALPDAIPLSDEWKTYSAPTTVMKIVCQTSNRMFVGAPVCRNADYQKVIIGFALEILKALIGFMALPSFFKPYVVPIFSNITPSIRQCSAHLEPLILERREKQAASSDGNWEDKPNDLLMWCMDNGREAEQSVTNLTRRIILVNFAAIHMSTTALTYALYNLVTYPECIPVLRQEVESIVGIHGWSKRSLNKMLKLDSFLRETLRLHSVGTWGMQRLTLKPFTFSDGTRIPAGTMIGCPVVPMQTDPGLHNNPKEFQPWRFCGSTSGDTGDEDRKRFLQLTSTTPDFIIFGHGKVACPGRFFGSLVLKILLARMVITYDIAFESGRSRPPNIYISSASVPGDVNLVFRKRQN